MFELFHQVKTVKVEKRINEIVNRLNKTKIERIKPDLKVRTAQNLYFMGNQFIFNYIQG